jgi:hypothetical protein
MKIFEVNNETKFNDVVLTAIEQMIQNDLPNFEFDVHGHDPDGNPIIIHFQATIQMVGNS